MSEKKSKSVIAGYLHELKELTSSEGNYAYRGQKNAELGVESGASRRIKKINSSEGDVIPKEDFISYHEKELLEPARMDGLGVEEGRKLTDLELLAKLQHHGAATCLIDFTRNFFVAMWFACQSHKEEVKEGKEAKEEKELKETDGKIFILDTSDWKNFRSLEKEDLEKKVRPILTFKTRNEATSSKEETTLLSMLKPLWWHWSPQGLIERILKQDSLFIFGQPKIEGTLLQEIKIKHEHKDEIIEELEELGITERTLFKDLPGFAESHDHNKSLPRGYGTPKYYLRMGNEALQRGDIKGAIANYNRVIEPDLDFAKAYENRGIAEYDQIIELKPTFVEAYNNRGEAKYNLGDLNGAIADLDRAIELNPDLASAYYNLGNVKFGLGDYRGAKVDYGLAIERKRDFAEAYSNRGSCKFLLGDNSGAIEDYDQAIKHEPKDTMAYNNRGIVKVSDGERRGAMADFNQAMADFNQAIELDPDFAEAYINRGNVNRILGRNSVAIADFNRAIELDPDNVMAYNNRGLVKNVIADNNRAIKLKPDDAEAYNNRWLVKSAIADYDRAIEIKPDFAKAYCDRGKAKSDLGDHSGAIADYNRAIKLKPGYVEAYNNRGTVKSIILGEHSEAIADFNRAIKLRPDDAKTYYNRGVVYTSLADKEKLEDKEMSRRDFLTARELAEQNGNEQLVRLCNEALLKLDNENNNRS